jgi:hypothetical protein
MKKVQAKLIEQKNTNLLGRVSSSPFPIIEIKITSTSHTPIQIPSPHYF